jgi:hypothetical protein
MGFGSLAERRIMPSSSDEDDATTPLALDDAAWVSEDHTSDEEALLRPSVYGEDGDIEWDD